MTTEPTYYCKACYAPLTSMGADDSNCPACDADIWPGHILDQDQMDKLTDQAEREYMDAKESGLIK